MTSKERVVRTLTFDYPDKIPVDNWCLPAAVHKYGKALKDALRQYSIDLYTPIFEDRLPLGGEHFLEVGTYRDGWDCNWHNLYRGATGEVKEYPLADYGRLDDYKSPKALLVNGWGRVDSSIRENRDKFILAPWTVNIFERMQFLRGMENLFMDLMEDSPEVYRLRDIVADFYEEWLRLWLEKDVDGIVFSDDWGSQRALLISPQIFRRFFKPVYKELIGRARAKGKYVFFHSDGYIAEIYDDMIELGVDALNSQLWCMDMYKISEKYRGKITFWGEINRQTTLAYGTQEEIREKAAEMKKLLMHQGGGLIGTCAPGDECPLENIVESMTCWNE